MRQRLYRGLRRLRRDQRGVTAMEYALIAAATAVTISSFMPGIGTNLSRSFSEVRAALEHSPFEMNRM